ncbi:MAG TPA: response regulator [Candidatus Bathyarchaeia archaeon]|nr:response regulator [Candidatus Bathyarchaeia archaeon]
MVWNTEKKEIKILLVEDLEEHVLLIKNTLEHSGLKKSIWVCRDGEAALDYLYNRGDYASKEKYSKPDIIVLDLRLPKLDGLEVLKRIKSEESLKDIPVVVLTASEETEDIRSVYNVEGTGYLLKSAFIVEKSKKMEGLLDAILSFGY